MTDPGYVIETSGKKVGLEFHLSTAFYPPLPEPVKEAFVSAFEGYWNHEYDTEYLESKLRTDAGYMGDLGSYNFWQFLNEEDLH